MSHKQRKHHKYDSAPWDLTLVGCLLSGRKMFLVKKKKISDCHYSCFFPLKMAAAVFLRGH